MNLLFDLPLLSLSLYRISASLTWKHLDNKKYIFAWEWTTNCLYFLQATGTEWIEPYTILLAF